MILNGNMNDFNVNISLSLIWPMRVNNSFAPVIQFSKHLLSPSYVLGCVFWGQRHRGGERSLSKEPQELPLFRSQLRCHLCKQASLSTYPHYLIACFTFFIAHTLSITLFICLLIAVFMRAGILSFWCSPALGIVSGT